MTATRDTVKTRLKDLLGVDWFLKDTEEFDGTPSGIWTTNERTCKALDGLTISDYNGVHPKVQKIMDETGWFVEHYDSGTLMLFPT